ncbi:MAG: acetyl-CoA carboxylase biotin carboxylase subunit, partial [Clostridia bacterium]|nr:acetyl-CoA carboxylase biotin carboxylase subunit [Clostridia bacterium]
MIRSILIANRGEIAARIIKTANKMNISSVAVYSDADKTASFLQEADETVCIGGNTPLESYLDSAKIIAAAVSHGCDAIHPGYGFLAENSVFVEQCREAGLIFIGP